MKIVSNSGGVFATNSFLIADEAAKEAVIFDAPDHTTSPLLDEAAKQGWKVIGLWFTHGHIDHIADHAVVSEKCPSAQLLLHRLDWPKLRDPRSMYALPFTIPGREPHGELSEGQLLKIGRIEVQVLHTPGHAPGHVVFHIPSEKVLVGGDLIIMGSVGRTDFPDCSFPDLCISIRRVMKLPGETTLLPGHGDISTLADELQTNESVREAVDRG